MNHEWILNPKPLFKDGRDFICKKCNIKSFLNRDNEYLPYNINGKAVYDDLTCEECIIKQIIE
jgi:hypothetical protein